MRWALLLALLSTSALASRADRLSVSPRLDRRDRLGAAGAEVDPILLSLSLLPPDSECSGTPPDGVTFTRASAATCIKGDGTAVALSSNQARVHSTLGLLVEGSATNAVLHSRDVTAASWSNLGCSRTATGMDGAALVGRCTGATTPGQVLTVATGARTASAYVRRQSGTCNVTLSADSESTSRALIGGWERLTLTYTSDGTVTLGVGVSSGCVADVDYVQDEAGTIATSPIVTSGTAAVRAGEVASVPRGAQSVFEGCAAIDVTPNWSGNRSTYILSGEALPGATNLLYSTTGAVIASIGVAGSGPAALAGSHSAGVAQRFRSEYSAAASSLRVCAGSTCSTPVAFSSYADFGAHLPVGSRNAFIDHVNGHIRNLVLGRTPEACQ